MLVNNPSQSRNGYFFSLLGTFQYLIFLALAMYLYGGGNQINADYPTYDFFSNYISDLGRIISISNNSNLLSCIIYSCSSAVLAISLLVFLYFFKQIFNNIFSKIGNFFGIICCCSLLIGSFTFWDIFGDLHLIFANIFNISGLFTTLFFAIAIFKNQNYPKFYGIMLLILFFSGIIYALTFITFSPDFNQSLFYLQVISQKIVHFLFIFTFLIQEVGALKSIKFSFE